MSVFSIETPPDDFVDHLQTLQTEHDDTTAQLSEARQRVSELEAASRASRAGHRQRLSEIERRQIVVQQEKRERNVAWKSKLAELNNQIRELERKKEDLRLGHLDRVARLNIMLQELKDEKVESLAAHRTLLTEETEAKSLVKDLRARLSALRDPIEQAKGWVTCVRMGVHPFSDSVQRRVRGDV